MMFVSNTMRADDVISQFRILGGELSNSAATSVSDIDEVLPRMKALGLNTVLVPVYWEFLEPVEGQLDFTLVDRTIEVARQQGLKIVPEGCNGRRKTIGDSLVLEWQRATGRPESLFRADAAYR